MKTARLRKQFLDFFEKKGHYIAQSDSLISSDPSLLFTIAGMVPFIPYMLGTQNSPYKRIASCQKCIRTQDIENVGKTTRHGTFFQMNGNFSFGDYFKKEAIEFAWEFITSSVRDGGLGLESNKISVSVYKDDVEAIEIWKKTANLPDSKIYRWGMGENYWSTGMAGPAGPCSEIYYDRGSEFGQGTTPFENEDRFLEIWNLVFTGYERADGGTKDNFEIIGELKHKNIDTGMGLERVAALMQNVPNIYEIDEIKPVIDKVCEIGKLVYGANEQHDIYLRVIADHVRATLMLINDGINPSNEARGYVVRRLLRRIIRSLRLLGISKKVFAQLFLVSKELMQESYPSLKENWNNILSIFEQEEDSFSKTLANGTEKLNSFIKKAKDQNNGVLSGSDAFLMHDTYGFPIDLTIEIAQENQVSVDLDGFNNSMKEQKDRARNDTKNKKDSVGGGDYASLLQGIKTEFVGYENLETQNSRVIAIIQDGELVDSVAKNKSTKVEIILNKTPFYATKGGQQADVGTIFSLENGMNFEVLSVESPIENCFVHLGIIKSGTIKVNDIVSAKVEFNNRQEIKKAHTATHILHKILTTKLGKSSSQAGSQVYPGKFRFDFHYSSAVEPETLKDIELEVNKVVQQDYLVQTKEMPLEQAKQQGAVALFSEKYGSVVRVITIGNDWSSELCGGTHAESTGKIGLVKIVSESSIGSSIRRIEAITGLEAYLEQAKQQRLLQNLAKKLNTSSVEISNKIDDFQEKIKQLELEKQEILNKDFFLKSKELLQKSYLVDNGSAKAIVEKVDNVPTAQSLRELAQNLINDLGNNSTVVLIGIVENKPIVLGFNTNKLVHIGNIVKETSLFIGGGGGGNPKFAQGGGSKVELVPKALENIKKALN